MNDAPAARTMVLMFTDIVGSVDLKTRHGDVGYTRLISQHDELFSRIMTETPGAEILSDTGDGFFARFATASDATSVALTFQKALAEASWDPEPIRVRIGIHIGEVSEFGAARGRKVVGLAADVASRIMGLALPGQILMTRTTFDDARQYLRGHSIHREIGADLRWMAHGQYVFKGKDESLGLFEVGISRIAPLTPPPDSEKASRAVSADEQATLGWRPATGLEVPRRKGWTLESKVGQGGFGEVWLAAHRKTKDTRVFKFCFDTDRLRSFKRELTLFRLIREVLGERKDIARLLEIEVDQAPFYLESEYTEAGDLKAWAEGQGGIDQVPLDTRLDLVARTAEAVAAAHSIGILHKDIKPANILMYYADDGTPRPRLSDFGIGVLADRSTIEQRDITIAGFTEAGLLDENESSRTGTRVYAPPETLVGEPFTIEGDVYALGVLLYQMVVGDLNRALGTGWERDVANEELRDDIAHCVDREPSLRFKSAAELARRIRELETRARERRRAARRKTVARAAIATVAALVVVAGGLTLHSVRVARERDRANAEWSRAEREAEAANRVTEFLIDLFEVSDPGEARGNSITAREVLDRGAAKIDRELLDQPAIQGRLMVVMGRVYMKLGLYDAARPLLEDAPGITQSAESQNRDVVRALTHLGILLRETGDFEQARSVFDEASKVAEQTLGPDHLELAEALNNLGLLLFRMGEHSAAISEHEHALAIREAALGPRDQHVAQSLNNIALSRMALGDYDEAGQLLERALEIHEQALGADHPFVADVSNNLGMLYQRLEDFDRSRTNYERALAIREKILGPAHPDVATALDDLATLLHGNGDYADARAYYDRALEIRTATLPPDHPDIATNLNNLGNLLLDTGDLQQARPLLERALEIDRKTLGEDHYYVAMDLNGLATVLRDLGRVNEARPKYRRALAILDTIEGTDHLPELVSTLENYAGLLRGANETAQALELEARAAAIKASRGASQGT